MKTRSAAENVPSSNGRTPSAIRTGRRSDDMNVAHVGGDHLESQLPLQPGGEVSGPRAEVQHGSLGRQPCAHLLQQLTRSPFHDGVK